MITPDNRALEHMEALAKLARQESPPAVDVTERVLQALRAESAGVAAAAAHADRPALIYRIHPLAWSAAAACIVAAVSCLIAGEALGLLVDPWLPMDAQVAAGGGVL